MKYIALLMALFILSSCKAQSQHDLNVPDIVQLHTNASALQLPGTRIFMEQPKGYTLVKQLIRLQKNEQTYIQALEVPGANFEEKKTELVKGLDEAVKSGKLPKAYYQKEFKLGNYDALISYGPDNEPGKEQIVLCFGDKDVTVMVMAALQANDSKSCNEMVKSLLTMRLDKNAPANAAAIANYSLDLSGTDFKYAGNVSQLFYYNTEGTATHLDDPFASQIVVATLPSADGKEALKQYAEERIAGLQADGITIPTHEGHDITINGRYAYEITFQGTYQGKASTDYIVVTGDNKSAVYFVGTAYEDQEHLMSQIKKIAQTLKLK
jgi:hypothetical protein